MTKKKETENALVLASDNLPAELDDMIGDDEGLGLSSDPEDNKVPLVYVLQSNSPQVNERGPDYVEGAKSGNLWLRNAPEGYEIVDGEEGFLFQPCFFWKNWVEWIPRNQGGGIVGSYEHRPAEAKQHHDPDNPRKKVWRLDNGNEVIETRYHAGLILTEDGLEMPYILVMTGSNHSVSKDWMTSMNNKRTPGGKKPPSFACIYRVKTKHVSTQEFNWFRYEIEDAGWANKERYNRGLELAKSFASGEKTAEEDADVVDATPTTKAKGEVDDDIPF